MSIERRICPVAGSTWSSGTPRPVIQRLPSKRTNRSGAASSASPMVERCVARFVAVSIRNSVRSR
jgi:hypothetical protein